MTRARLVPQVSSISREYKHHEEKILPATNVLVSITHLTLDTAYLQASSGESPILILSTTTEATQARMMSSPSPVATAPCRDHACEDLRIKGKMTVHVCRLRVLVDSVWIHGLGFRV